jgi:hypothetical protein
MSDIFPPIKGLHDINLDFDFDDFKKRISRGLGVSFGPSLYPPTNKNFKLLERRGDYEHYQHRKSKESVWLSINKISDEGIESAFYDGSLDRTWVPTKDEWGLWV